MYHTNHNNICLWEKIYLEEGKEALLEERRGRSSVANGVRKGREPQLSEEQEKSLLEENQQLRMEIEYLKKLNALVLKEDSKTISAKIEELRAEISDWKLLQFAKIPCSTFYYYLHQSKQPDRYSQVKEEIQPQDKGKAKRPESCGVQNSDRSGYLIQILYNFWGHFTFKAPLSKDREYCSMRTRQAAFHHLLRR